MAAVAAWVIHTSLLISKLLEGGSSVLAKAALNTGSSSFVIAFYTGVLGSIVNICISCSFAERGLPSDLSLFLRILAAGSLQCCAKLLSLGGISYTTPVLSSIGACTVPMLSAAIAVVLGIERLKFLRYDGLTKVSGICVACGGAIVLTLYRGPAVFQPTTRLTQAGWLGKWSLGAAMILTSDLCTALLLSIETPIYRKYQAPWRTKAFVALVAALLSGAVGLIIKDIQLVSLSWNSTVAFILYNGLLVHGVAYGMRAWSISKASLFLVCCYAAFSPVTSAILSLIFLRSTIYFGTVLGGVLVIFGVILVGWSEVKTKKLDIEEALIT